jgi:hypothetical protein
MDPGAARTASYSSYFRWLQAFGIRLPHPRPGV